MKLQRADTTSLKSTHRQCTNCQFWLSLQDIYCPNCNTNNAKSHPEKLKGDIVGIGEALFFVLPTPAVTVAVTLLLQEIFNGPVPVIAPFLMSLPELLAVPILMIIFFGGILPWTFLTRNMTRRIKKRLISVDFSQPQPISCLIQQEGIIQQRITEIETRKQGITAIQQRLKQITDGEQREQIDTTLQSASSALNEQLNEYKTKLQEIQLIRWHNTIQPLINVSDQNDTFSLEYLYSTLSVIRNKGNELLSSWEQEVFASTPLGLQNIKRLRDALSSCDHFYQDLVTHHAASTVKGVSYFKEIAPTEQFTEHLVEQIEVFNALPDVNAFSTGLQALEEEYFRLKSEEEMVNFA